VNGETGFLVNPLDPDEIAAALERLAGDPALRAEMGAAGRRRVERELDHERAAREIYAVFAEHSRDPLPAWVPRAAAALSERRFARTAPA
jgi:glycosyltransferase involved in cell wall biosynthesis